jgi:hypothetical protein
MRSILRLLACMIMLLLLCSCQRAYFGAMERLGFPKRDILIDRVENARESQEEAAEQFASALDRFRSVIAFEGGELERRYDALNAEYERSRQKAREVSARIDGVEDVAGALFAEWERELGQYQDKQLRESSRKKLSATRQRYGQLIKAMRRAEARMAPVLETFEDHVLYLKHNLNARAVASLEGELGSVEAEVEALVRSMKQSIMEADAFIEEMR